MSLTVFWLLCLHAAHALVADLSNLTPADGVTIVGADNMACGVSISHTDVNNDGFDDLITVCGSGHSFLMAGAAQFQLADSLDPSSPAPHIFLDMQNGGRARRIAGCQDINGDGLHDIVLASSVATRSGFVDIWFGNRDLEMLARSVRIDGPSVDRTHLAYFGSSVSCTDVDGDGKADVLIGSSRADTRTKNAAGAAFILYGQTFNAPLGNTTDLFSSSPDGASFEGFNPGDGYGSGVGSLGDINGDGHGDFAFGAQAHWNSNVGLEGTVHIHFGPDSNRVSGIMANDVYDVDVEGQAQRNLRLGGAEICGADLDNDGFNDIVIPSAQSQVFVIWGNATLPRRIRVDQLDNVGLRLVVGNGPNDDPANSTATRVACGGDINGDGFDDIVVGGPDNDEERGVVHVVFGFDRRPSGTTFRLENLTPSRSVSWYGEQPSDELGTAVDVADLNGDGLFDIVVSAASHGADRTGKLYVVFGKQLDATTAAGGTARPTTPAPTPGQTVATSSLGTSSPASNRAGSTTLDSSRAGSDSSATVASSGTAGSGTVVSSSKPSNSEPSAAFESNTRVEQMESGGTSPAWLVPAIAGGAAVLCIALAICIACFVLKRDTDDEDAPDVGTALEMAPLPIDGGDQVAQGNYHPLGGSLGSSNELYGSVEPVGIPANNYVSTTSVLKESGSTSNYGVLKKDDNQYGNLRAEVDSTDGYGAMPQFKDADAGATNYTVLDTGAGEPLYTNVPSSSDAPSGGSVLASEYTNLPS